MNTKESIPVEVELTYKDFVKKYLKPGKPVLIKGALKTLPAAKWTPENLGIEFSNKIFSIDGSDTSFREFIDAVLESSPEKPASYLRNIGINPNFSELIPALQPGIPYTYSNWRFLPFWPKWYCGDPTNFCQFFLTGHGREFPFMHVDYPPMDTFSGLAYGSKEWLLFSPEDTPNLYSKQKDDSWPMTSAVENPFEPDLTKYPKLSNAVSLRVVQEAGDVIFVPNGWWHTTRSHTPTITVAWDHLSASCFKKFIDYKQSSPAFENRHGIYKLLVRYYLLSIGTILKLRDEIRLPFLNNVKAGRIV